MRKLGIYLVITLGAILLAPFVIDQLFFFFFLGKIPFTNISLPAILMVIFWAIIVPSAIILRKSLSVLFWELISIAGEIAQRRINRKIRYFTPNQKSELILLSIYLLSSMKKSEPYDEIESQKLAPSMT
ncbi:hypothetical protein [Candidatus Nanosynbacter sp. TM7-057]|uniref:hypothetical protein n=1 Tax=Candidatus Nanosynbacter sp. TM7-057 TaxID=2902630 RepID=UPI001FB5B578|nr:hypothetical protein [Candidatus Nanosynbacter sp. TM7-057]MCJ1964942.1 hypothetical protein [Candidatus Nanosynbacter sp. TM7-057]